MHNYNFYTFTSKRGQNVLNRLVEGISVIYSVLIISRFKFRLLIFFQNIRKLPHCQRICFTIFMFRIHLAFWSRDRNTLNFLVIISRSTSVRGTNVFFQPKTLIKLLIRKCCVCFPFNSNLFSFARALFVSHYKAKFKSNGEKASPFFDVILIRRRIS